MARGAQLLAWTRQLPKVKGALCEVLESWDGLRAAVPSRGQGGDHVADLRANTSQGEATGPPPGHVHTLTPLQLRPSALLCRSLLGGALMPGWLS